MKKAHAMSKSSRNQAENGETLPPISFMAGPAGISHTSNQFQPSERIGRYKLLEQLGEGGFGIVYMAEQEEPVRRRVAVKVIKPGMDTKQVIGRFEAERQALAMLDHPNIAKVLDAGSTDQGRPYFVMELVKGERITDFCDANHLDTTQRLELFIDVCNAIQHAHQKGIIHRDIKPSNVLVTLHDDRAVPKVIDFGVAKATEQRLTEQTVFTEFKQLVGTPAYMSPEQATFSGLDIDTRSDVYSLGVLLYELLSGVPPFDDRDLRAKGLEELCRVIRESIPPMPSTRVSSLGEQSATVSKNRNSNAESLRSLLRGEVDWIVMKALEKDRTRRYETTNALGMDIKRYLAQEPVLAGPPSTLYQFRKFLQRHRRAAVSALAIAASLVIGTLFAISGWSQAHQRADQLAASDARLRRNLYATEMAIAKREFDRNAVARTIEILEKYISQEREPDLRDFEWRWLWKQCHREVFEFSGGPIHDVRAGGAPFRDMRISPDGRWLATGATDGHVRLWDMETKEHVWSFEGNWHCNCVDFSPDSRLLLASFERNFSGIKSRTHIWNLDSEKLPVEKIVMERFGEQPCGTRFLPDGSGVVSDDGAEFNLAGHQTREAYITPASSDTDEIWMRHYSSDWSTAASKDRIWDVVSGRLLKRLPQHSGYWQQGPVGVAISPVDPYQMVTCSSAGIRIWNREGTLVKQVTKSTDQPTGWLSFSNDGELLAVRGFTGSVQVFETETWTQIDALHVPSSDNSVLFSPNDRNLLLAGGCDGVIRGYDIARKNTQDTSIDFPSKIMCLRFSPDGKLLALGGRDGLVRFWDVRSRSTTHEIRSNQHNSDGVFDFIGFSPDSRFAAVVGPEDTMSVWNVDRWEVVARWKEPNAAYWTACFSKDGRRLYGGDWRKSTIHAWDWPSISEEFRPDAMLVRRLRVAALDTSSSGLVGSAGLNTRVWATPDWKPIFDRSNDVAMWYFDSNDLVFSPKGDRLAISSGRIVELFDVPPKNSTGRMAHSAQVRQISWSPSAKRLVASDRSGTTRLWDVSTKQPVATFPGTVSSFSPNGTMLAVGDAVESTEISRITIYYAPPLGEIEASSAYRSTRTRSDAMH